MELVFRRAAYALLVWSMCMPVALCDIGANNRNLRVGLNTTSYHLGEISSMVGVSVSGEYHLVGQEFVAGFSGRAHVSRYRNVDSPLIDIGEDDIEPLFVRHISVLPGVYIGYASFLDDILGGEIDFIISGVLKWDTYKQQIDINQLQSKAVDEITVVSLMAGATLQYDIVDGYQVFAGWLSLMVSPSESLVKWRLATLSSDNLDIIVAYSTIEPSFSIRCGGSWLYHFKESWYIGGGAEMDLHFLGNTRSKEGGDIELSKSVSPVMFAKDFSNTRFILYVCMRTYGLNF